MSDKKQFGVWMDAHHATVVGMEHSEESSFVVVGHVKNNTPTGNSNEHTAHNHEATLQQKYFKEITSLMQNVDEMHVTGTGDAQEQFIKYLSETPQYKNVVAHDSTSNKMSDEKLIELITNCFN